MSIKKEIKKAGLYRPTLDDRKTEKYLLLDFNERTVGPNKKIKDALRKTIGSGVIQLYPEYGELNKKVADYVGIKKSQIMMTNGSCQAIDIIMRAFLKRNDKVIIHVPNFSMIYQYAEILGARILKTPYEITEKDIKFPFKRTLEVLDKSIKLAVIVSPHNPTGTVIYRKELLEILDKAKKSGTAILCDEAYFEFSHATAADLVNKYDNLYVTRTFSKAFGLASLRLGYIISQEKNIRELSKMVSPYDVNIFAKMAGLAALDNLASMKSYVKEVMDKSKPILERFFRKNEITFYSSSANFLLIRPCDRNKTLSLLQHEGVWVRLVEEKGFEDFVRITVGTVEDTKRLIKVYSKILKEGSVERKNSSLKVFKSSGQNL